MEIILTEIVLFYINVNYPQKVRLVIYFRSNVMFFRNANICEIFLDALHIVTFKL